MTTTAHSIARPGAASGSRAHFVGRMARVALGAALLAAASQAHLMWRGTPVPVTLGPQAALLLGAWLGPVEGPLAVFAWLQAGLLGAPAFASGLTGLSALLGPTSGFAVGYLPAAYLTGRFGRGGAVHHWLVWMAASAAILALGTAWLAVLLGPAEALQAGGGAFAWVDACKATLVFAALGGTRRAVRGLAS